MPGETKSHGEDLRSQIIPLSTVKDKWLLGRRLIADQKAGGSEHALHAMLVALKNLYYKKDERWHKIRDNVKLGLIKDTVRYGNTSVSMGAAKSVPAFEDCVGFLNCGTGGIKYQMYSVRDLLHVEAEFKPKNGCSPNALEVGSYKPKGSVAAGGGAAVATVEAQRALLLKELAEAPWRNNPSTPVYAFVTGTLRQHWEDKPQERAVLEAEMSKLFEGTGVQPLKDSFFLSQDDEGRLELVGTSTMYANLVTAQQLDPGTNVVVSLGIGRGSCQWMVLKANGEAELVPHKFGMSDLPNLALLSSTLMNAYSKPEAWSEFLDAMEGTACPVIALKSGAMLLFESDANIKKEFKASLPPEPECTVQIVQNGSHSTPVTYTWAGSLDELCAEANELLGARADFETIYQENGVEVNSRTEIKNQQLLVLAPLGEAFVKPDPPAQTPKSSAESRMQLKTKQAYTASRKRFQSELNKTANDELVRWIGEALGRPLDAKLTTALNDGGQTLCELVAKVTPIKYHANVPAGSFKARENVNHYFAQACQTLGIRRDDICTADQIANEEMGPVIYCLLLLVGAMLQQASAQPLPAPSSILQHLMKQCKEEEGEEEEEEDEEDAKKERSVKRHKGESEGVGEE